MFNAWSAYWFILVRPLSAARCSSLTECSGFRSSSSVQAFNASVLPLFMATLFTWSGRLRRKKIILINKKICDANEGKCAVSATFARAQTLLYCPGRRVSAQLCSQPNCGSDPLPSLIRHTKSPGNSDSFPVNPIYSSQAVMSSLQTYLLHCAGSREAAFEYFIIAQ